MLDKHSMAHLGQDLKEKFIWTQDILSLKKKKNSRVPCPVAVHHASNRPLGTKKLPVWKLALLKAYE